MTPSARSSSSSISLEIPATIKELGRVQATSIVCRRCPMKLAAVLMMLALAALLGGCSTARSLVPGQSTEADVRARMGAPKETRTEPNGDLVWEYPTGPEGFFTYAVRMGPDKRVKEVTQLVSEEQLDKIVEIGRASCRERR